MKRAERVAIVRIFSDLIKADTIIDSGEMEMYARIKSEYSITKDIEREANETTLSSAIKTLSDSDEKTRNVLLNKFSEMTLSDGFCVPKEALLMIALNQCLQSKSKDYSKVHSVILQGVSIEDNQAIYVESAYDEKANDEIRKSYRQISNELRLAGFNFVYIPYIAKHFKEYNESIFRDVASFLAPNLSAEETTSLIEQLSNMTTDKFCKDQLCNRFGMESLRNTKPSLLIKISDNYVDNTIYANFLKIEFYDGILEIVQQIVESYSQMLSTNELIIPNKVNSEGQFLYHGFYKQLFDMYTIRNGVSSNVVVNLNKGVISLPEIGREIDGLRRKEKAFYIMMLIKSHNGGINFELPQTASQLNIYNENIKEVKELYGRIYEMLGGNKSTAPDIAKSEIRLPIVSNIRKNIDKFRNTLKNIDDYSIRKDENGNYYIPLSQNMIKINGNF